MAARSRRRGGGEWGRGGVPLPISGVARNLIWGYTFWLVIAISKQTCVNVSHVNKTVSSARVYRRVFFRLLLGCEQDNNVNDEDDDIPDDDDDIIVSSWDLASATPPVTPPPAYWVQPPPADDNIADAVDNLIFVMNNLIVIMNSIVHLLQQLIHE